MTDRVRRDSVAKGLVRAVEECRAEGVHCCLSYVQVIDRDVDVHLLWDACRVPLRRNELADALQRNPRRCLRFSERHPFLVVLDSVQPHHPFVKASQGARSRTINDEAVQGSDHVGNSRILESTVALVRPTIVCWDSPGLGSRRVGEAGCEVRQDVGELARRG